MMIKYATLNKISPKGLADFDPKQFVQIDDPKEAQAILVRSQKMHDMEFGGNLLAVARAGAGTNNIPAEKLGKTGVVVFNTPGANANAVKELVLGAMLVAARNIVPATEWVSSHPKELDTVEKIKSNYAGAEIAGKTLGVIGIGAIGVKVANAAVSLGMKVVGYDPYMSLRHALDLSPEVKIVRGPEGLLGKCDYVTLHLPALDNTKGMVDGDFLSAMKETAVLLNFARDTLINEKALVKVLKAGKIGGYVTDFPTAALAGLPGVIGFPHLGASTAESEENCATMAVAEIKNYLFHGIIENSVNYPELILPELSMNRLVVLHENIPNTIGSITGQMAKLKINIENMVNQSRGELAATALDFNKDAKLAEVEKAFAFPGIIKVRLLQP